MSFLNRFSKNAGPVYLKSNAPGDSSELRRILALPRRARPESISTEALKEKLSTNDDNCECLKKYRRLCCKELMPVQAWALTEAAQTNGILGPIGVGHGKTLLDLLTPMVIDGCKTAMLLLPPSLKAQLLETDWHYYAQHWKLPNLVGGRWLTPGRPTLYVVAYSELSGSSATDLLERIKPDTVICDEAHSVRNFTAARTKRLSHYLRAHQETKFFAWSGTLTSRSIRDYAHLSNFALKAGSPTPRTFPVIEEWAGHLDPGEMRSPPGALSVFGADDAREGFQRRLIETPGVISSGDSDSCQASLTVSTRPTTAPEDILKHIASVQAKWQRPDGEEFVDAMSVGRCLRELSCGFFYRWRFPRRESPEVINRWLAVRKEWHKELREKLKMSRPHMDSPLLCTKAAIRWYKGYSHEMEDESRVDVPAKSTRGPLPVWPAATWPEWEEVHNTVKPETEAVWLDEWLVDDAIEWLMDGPGIVWYEFSAFAEKFMRKAKGRGVLFAGPGEEGNRVLLNLKGDEKILASVKAHGVGKNLQSHSRNLVITPASSGGEWEQLLGRTSRKGQLADEVTFDVYQHTEPIIDALDRARDLSQYIEETFGATQKLVSKATWRL